jgi:GNAT superfamily N-acetyltransferase
VTRTSELIPPQRAHDVLDVMCDAFRDYPVMRYVLGEIAGPDDSRLRALIGLFVGARALREEPMFGVSDGDRLIGAATTTLPGELESPLSVAALRERTWSALGADARARYEAFIGAGERFYPSAPHHHLNMLGVRRSHAGHGLARPLLEAVHALADADPGSAGVTLSTENAKNLGLYAHFGYAVRGHARVADALETWVLFRAKAARAEAR